MAPTRGFSKLFICEMNVTKTSFWQYKFVKQESKKWYISQLDNSNIRARLNKFEGKKF